MSAALAILRGMLRTASAFDPTTSRRTFVIALQEQPAAALAPHLSRAVLAAGPGLRLSFVYPPEDIVGRLEDGSIDILVAPTGREHGPLLARALMEDELVTAQRKGHPRGQGALDLEAFCALDHLIVSTDGLGSSGFVDRSLAGLGRTRRVALSIQSYALAPVIVAGSDCVCTLPKRLLQRHSDRLDLYTPPIDLPRLGVVALWHSRNQADEGHGWLRSVLYEAATENRDSEGTVSI